MSPELLFLYSRVPYKLLENVPILSGNMKNNIRLISVEDKEIVFMIAAPQYDLKKWQKEKIISFTGEMPDYAVFVNDTGGFGTHNRSEHWVNRALYELCYELKRAKGNNVEIQNTLELNYGVGYMRRSGTK